MVQIISQVLVAKLPRLRPPFETQLWSEGPPLDNFKDGLFSLNSFYKLEKYRMKIIMNTLSQAWQTKILKLECS